MSKTTPVATTFVLSALLVLPSLAAAQNPATAAADMAAIRAAESSLNSELREAERGGAMAGVMQELRRVFSGNNREAKLAALKWIATQWDKGAVPSQVADEMTMLFVELNPKDTDAMGVREAIARRHLAAAPREERAAKYWQAVREGKVIIEGVAEIVRIQAILLAAGDGLEELVPAIDQYAGEIDMLMPHADYRESALVRWTIELRRGAKDRRDAARVHVGRLGEMDDQRFWELMQGDRAFNEATLAVLAAACENAISAPCQELAKIDERQHVLWEKKRKENPQTAESTSPAPDPEVEGPHWLQSFRIRTGSARFELSKARAKGGEKRQ
jgi:hypothetical protein